MPTNEELRDAYKRGYMRGRRVSELPQEYIDELDAWWERDKDGVMAFFEGRSEGDEIAVTEYAGWLVAMTVTHRLEQCSSDPEEG